MKKVTVSEGTAKLCGNRNSIGEELRRYLANRQRLISGGISDFLHCHYEGQMLEVAKYATGGGKLLRGVLTFLICEALGGQSSDALAAAVAVELAHAASLVHDDLIDGDVSRRARPALHVQYDVATAILIPHLIVPQSILSAQVYGPKAINAILEGWARVVKGQVRDYVIPKERGQTGFESNGCLISDGLADSQERVEGVYWEIVGDKTAALFETAAILGAIAARDEANAARAQEYARLIGIAFQIADDITDFQSHLGEVWSGLLGANAYFGRSLHALHRMIAVEGEEVITIEAIDRAKRLVAFNLKCSAQCAAEFPDSPVSELLQAFPTFALDQIYAEVAGGGRFTSISDGNPARGES